MGINHSRIVWGERYQKDVFFLYEMQLNESMNKRLTLNKNLSVAKGVVGFRQRLFRGQFT